MKREEIIAKSPLEHGNVKIAATEKHYVKNLF